MGKLNPKQVENLVEPGTYEDGDCSGQLTPDTTLSFFSASAGVSPPLNV